MRADVVDLYMVRWFGGLTCDFWAENGKNKYKCKKQKQIPLRITTRKEVRVREGGAREADFSTTPFAKARTALVEMTVCRRKEKNRQQQNNVLGGEEDVVEDVVDGIEERCDEAAAEEEKDEEGEHAHAVVELGDLVGEEVAEDVAAV
jgi:hypothetical protein